MRDRISEREMHLLAFMTNPKGKKVSGDLKYFLIYMHECGLILLVHKDFAKCYFRGLEGWKEFQQRDEKGGRWRQRQYNQSFEKVFTENT